MAEVLRITDRKDEHGDPVPFAVHFVSFNKSAAHKPSKHYRWPKAVRCGASHDLAKHGQIGIKPVDGSHAQMAVNLCLIISINEETVT